MNILLPIALVVCVIGYVISMRGKKPDRSSRKVLTALAVLVVMFLLGAALVGCADDPVSHPGVVWRTLPHDDPNAVCIAETGLAAGGLIFVAATVPPAGVAAWFFYGASSFIAGMDTARCSEAADVYEPPFDVAFSCDGGVHIWTETFTRIYDVGVSMSHTFCFTEGSSGGGGGGGGGGW